MRSAECSSRRFSDSLGRLAKGSSPSPKNEIWHDVYSDCSHRGDNRGVVTQISSVISVTSCSKTGEREPGMLRLGNRNRSKRRQQRGCNSDFPPYLCDLLFKNGQRYGVRRVLPAGSGPSMLAILQLPGVSVFNACFMFPFSQ